MSDEQRKRLDGLIQFLHGAAPLSRGGIEVWFGDSHPDRAGAFWWRTELREAWQAAEADCDRIKRERDELREALQRITDTPLDSNSWYRIRLEACIAEAHNALTRIQEAEDE